MRQYDFETLETSADTAEVSVNSAQSDDFSENGSGENINVFTMLPNLYAIYIFHTSILA